MREGEPRRDQTCVTLYGLHQQFVTGGRVLLQRQRVVHQRPADSEARLVRRQVVRGQERPGWPGTGDHAECAVCVKEISHDGDGTEPNRRGQPRPSETAEDLLGTASATYSAGEVSVVRPRRRSIT